MFIWIRFLLSESEVKSGKKLNRKRMACPRVKHIHIDLMSESEVKSGGNAEQKKNGMPKG